MQRFDKKKNGIRTLPQRKKSPSKKCWKSIFLNKKESIFAQSNNKVISSNPKLALNKYVEQKGPSAVCEAANVGFAQKSCFVGFAQN